MNNNDQSGNDKDSTPDAIDDNDAGGAVDSPADDFVDGNGSGAPNGIDPATDEDDSDPENVPVFDLALTKITNVLTPVKLGETVPFTIEITNQGNITAQNIVINDYIPAGFTRANTNAGPNGTAWTGAGDGGTTTTTTIAGPLAPGATTTVTIDLIVNAQGTQASDYINIAEIKSVEDDNGTNQTNNDKDSTPDDNANNDAGGLVDSPADNVVDGNGTGAPQTGDPATDEDDSDPENAPIFDLALRKTTASNSPVKKGEDVLFNITVFNQGNIPAASIQISDYIPEGFELANNNNGNGGTWNGLGGAGSTVETQIAGPLAPGDSASVSITLTLIGAGNMASDYINTGEIIIFQIMTQVVQ